MSSRSASVCVILRRVEAGTEVLFIKRAVRVADRWSGHIALPGGHKDAEESDLEAAVRETLEEVGLDLNKYADFVRPLEARCIRAALRNRKPMMLQPFVFIMREEHNFVPLTPQVREVAAAFWYPLEALLNPTCRSFVSVSAGDRLNIKSFWGAFKGQLGDIVFEAVDLWPVSMVVAEGHALPALPWKLWGITLNIIHEILVSNYPSRHLAPIQTPSFASWDMRFYHHLLAALYARWQAGTVWRFVDARSMALSRKVMLPYALGASITARLVALIAALLHLYRRFLRST